MNIVARETPLGSELRVLVIEDSSEDAELLLAQLRRSGFQLKADVVQSAEGLRAVLPKGQDIVLSDYRMRGWNGMDALRIVQEQQDPPPFILVSGTIGEDVAVESLKAGVADFVLKDRPERLPHAVQRAIAEVAARRQQILMQEELRRSHEQLEHRVEQRTAELRAANDALRQERQRFQSLIEAIPDIIWTCDSSGRTDFVNQRWLEYSGLTFEGSINQGWTDAAHPEDLGVMAQRWRASLENGTTFEAEYRLRRANDNQYRWHLCRAMPLRNSSGEIVKWFGACTDIHDRKLASEAQAQLMAMRNDLVSHVSHALRTPLASLRGFSELLLTRDFPEEKRREFLSLILQESNRLSSLINEFLDLQRMESGSQGLHFETVDLAALIQERAVVFASPDRAHHLRLDIAMPLPKVVADREKLREVLNNLLSNAYKYSPEGGEVVLGARASDGELLLWVSDKGIGIPPQSMPHLFQKFYRVESSATEGINGTGLGLAMVKQVVELHRGRVWAESVPGQGSTFYVALPLSETQSAIELVKNHEQEVESSAPVLLVEDDLGFARLLREHLHDLGVDVRHTAYAEEALRWCREHPPKLLLLDLHLAGVMDGWDLLLAIKNDHRLQAVAVTVLAGSDPNTHGLALSGADYILKTAGPQELRRAVLQQAADFSGKSVLIADDDPVFRKRLEKIFRELGAVVREAPSGDAALKALEQRIPDLLVLDLVMPQFDGFEVLRRLRGERRAVNLRILVVTAKQLALGEKEYLTRKMASLVAKDQAGPAVLASAVARALEPQSVLSSAAQ